MISVFCILMGCTVSALLASSPTPFVENLGQFHPRVSFRYDLGRTVYYLEKDGFTMKIRDEATTAKYMEHLHHQTPLQEDLTIKKHALKFKVVRANSGSVQEPIQPENYRLNYFLGNDPDRWARNVKAYGSVIHRDILPFVDLRYDATFQGIKYNWHVKPGGHPQMIGMNILGHAGLSVRDDQLLIQTSLGTVVEAIPLAYQVIKGDTISIPCSYVINADLVGYEVGEYNPDYTLVIDPVVIFSTYSGSRADNFGFTATYDRFGNLYAGGITDGDTSDYPVTPGAYDRTYNGGTNAAPANLACDITISKYDATGQNLLYATYLGGGDSDYPHSLVVNNENDLVILGTSYSDNYPTTATAYQKDKKSGTSNTDIIVSKLSEDGSTLMGSTYLGGDQNDGLNASSLKYNYADDYRGDVIIDQSDHIFIATTTNSDNFPLQNAEQSTFGGFQDGILVELDTYLETMIWSTFVGGSGVDALFSIKIGEDDKIYVGGATTSTDLGADSSSFQPGKSGQQDGLLLKFDKSQRRIEHFSYFGKANRDQIYFVEIDTDGNIYATGQTTSNITKSDPGLYGTDGKGQFIFKTDTAFSALEWLTTFGSRDQLPDISPTAFLVDQCDHIYVSGWGSDIGFQVSGSTDGLEVTADAIQPETDGDDFYILVLDRDAQSLLHATYFGGDSTTDHVDGGTSRFDKKGVIYQSVCASCPGPGAVQTREISDFPTTSNSAFPLNFSPRCSNASFKIDFQVSKSVVAEFSAPLSACLNETIQFDNGSSEADKWLWDFGDGTVDSVNFEPSHQYEEPGVYTVTFKAFNPLTCNLEDETTQQIRVINYTEADFEYALNPCVDVLDFTLLTDDDDIDVRWDFGDGNESTAENPTHFYPNQGTYRIVLHVNERTPCPDSMIAFATIDTNNVAAINLYNAFTPNGDGINDCFGFTGITGDCIVMKWKVFNRWGEEVFEAKNGTECWNGQDRTTGRHYPEGTYFYLITLTNNVTGEEELISGTVTLFDD
jgi:gliding motility-associated-like protein